MIPAVWHGINPPIPTCESCGATKKNDLPVVEMERPGKTGSQLLNEHLKWHHETFKEED